jgi:hypothetical protein
MFVILSRPRRSVPYKDGVLDWILDLLNTLLTILKYNLLYSALSNYQLQSTVSVSHTAQLTTPESSWSAVPHQSSSSGFQRRMSHS